MTRRRIRLVTALLAVLTTGASSALAWPASAERVERFDPVGDVKRLTPPFPYRLPRTVDNTDAVRVVVDHRRARLVTSVTYASISRAGFEETFLTQEVFTSADARFHILVRLDYPLRRATVDVFGSGHRRCPAASASVDRPAARVRWVVPRGCLGNPASIKVRGAARSVDENTVERGDDLFSRGDPERRWSPWLAAG